LNGEKLKNTNLGDKNLKVIKQMLKQIEVKIPSIFFGGEESQCKHDYCKLNALIKICGFYKVDLKNTLVVRDGENDICCIKKTGIGISFCSTNSLVDSVADYVIKKPDFNLLLSIVK
jgi:hydroxymethylpyrimidine pyrophosphatase-like HAD family hydrolase